MKQNQLQQTPVPDAVRTPQPGRHSGRPKSVWNLIARHPWAALTATLLVILSAVLNISEVLVLEHFLNSFSDMHWKRALGFAAVLSAIYAFHYIQAPLFGYLNQKISLQLRGYLEHAVARKAERLSMAALEEKECQALLTRLQDQPEKRYAGGFSSMLQILGGALGTAAIFTLILQNAAFFIPVILLLLGLMIIAFRLIGTQKTALSRARKEIGRRSDYLSGILFDRRLAQEKKLFGYTPYIQKLYEEENISSVKRLFKSILQSNLILWFYDNITYLFSASAYLLLLIPLYQDKMDIGLYIAIIPALAKIGSFFVTTGSNYLPAYQEYRACLADLATLNSLPEQFYINDEAPLSAPPFHEIKGEQITFRYPGQETPVLDGLDFTFQIGRNYALAGENGCGKSTLIKLLLGFYKPERGTITIDGIPIQDMEFEKLQRFYSAVFQDYNRYEYTIRENIAMSSPEAATDPPEPCTQQAAPSLKMQQAAREAGLEEWIASCPNGYDTSLGSLEPGGVDLSGGQWQRLSIARMLYRKASVRIWDEPAASMDPLAESRLYTAYFRKRSPDCTNIFVTHRLGAAVHADEICVLAHGRIVEQGRHNVLMQKENGLYRKMFEAQKGMYE